MGERLGPSPEKLLEDTLQTVDQKLTLLVEGKAEGGKRTPVDCVAFGSAYAGVNDLSQVTSHHFSACYHPQISKDEYGCVLVREVEEGRIIRINGGVCKLRVKRGEKGAAKLAKAIEEAHPLPF